MPNVVATKTKVGTKTKVAIAIAAGAGLLALANAIVPLVFFSVTMKAPVSKAVLSGVTTLAATTSGSAAAVSFVVSGLPTSIAGVNKDGTGKTWAASWDTSAVADGSYSAYATAKNAKGVVVTSAKVLFTVSNKKAAAPKTAPTVSLTPLPSTVLTTGTATYYRFVVTAGSTGDVSLKKVSFRTVATNPAVALSAPAVREVGTGSDIPATAAITTSGSDCGFSADAAKRCVRVVFSAEQVIAAGTSKTYDLRMTGGGFASGDGVSTQLLGDAAAANGLLSGSAPATGIAGTPYDFLWSDNSAVPHGETTSDWWNGYYAVGLPGGAQTLTSS